MPDLIYDHEYKGIRYVYGLSYRPAAFANLPDGRIIGADRADARFRFGTVAYPRQLTEREVAGYELTPVELTE